MEKYCNTFTSRLLAKGLTFLFWHEMACVEEKRKECATVSKRPVLDEWKLWFGIMISPLNTEVGTQIATNALSSFFNFECEDDGFVLVSTR